LCFSCHESDYNSAPEHVAQNYPTTCEDCHNTDTWDDAVFDHSATNFPLTGAHTSVSCSSCHTNGYAGTPTECVSCHQDNYDAAQNPNHTAAGISNACESCHNTTAWVPSTFDHASTGFDLTGQHTSLQCSSCHDGTTSGASQLFSCHESDYNTAPEHVAQSYPTTCEDCHNTDTWDDAVFDHSTTNFPLTGAHTTVDCASCHTNGYSGTPTECFACHENNYNNASNPDHQTLGLATTCETCHTTDSGWAPAQFPDHDNYYQLVGAHASISNDCATCHNGDYNNTPNTCFGCHESDYNSTTNPPHQSAQFPTDCESCHTQNAWVPSTFDHDGQYFPIYSGEHDGEWDLCSDCHTNASDYSVFSCLGCHQQGETDGDHEGVSGYVYQSSACYDCHPNGQSDKLIKRLINDK